MQRQRSVVHRYGSESVPRTVASARRAVRVFLLVQLKLPPQCSHVEPLFLISPLAQHTRNLGADPRASVLVASPAGADPMQEPRATIIGTARPLEGEAEGAAWVSGEELLGT
jgi:hypothetical protein